jgi:tyrosyl-tRNA synthetase
MNSDEKYDLITRGLQEVIGGHNLRSLLDVRDPEVYWGTAPTGRVHIGYIVPLLKIRDCINAGCNMTILLADLHALLDNLKSTREQVGFRTEYYQRMITAILNRLGVDLSKVKFVRGMDYQLTPEVMFEFFKLTTVTRSKQAQKAGAEVVKQDDDPFVSSLLYPMLQALDEKYLNADAELGGIDQRKIFAYSRDYLPKIDVERKFTHLMNPIISLSKKKKGKAKKNADGEEELEKMSASDANGKIDMLDTPERIMELSSKIFCADGDLTDNSALYLIKIFIFPIEGKFNLVRSEENGGNITFSTFDELEQQVALGSSNGGIHPKDLQNSIGRFFSDFLEPIRNEFSLEENQVLLKNAYP